MVVDDDGNEKIIENNIEKNVSLRIDAVADNYPKIEDTLKDEEDSDNRIETQQKIVEQQSEKEDALKVKEIKSVEKLTKKQSMFVDFSSKKSDSSEKEVDIISEKDKSSYIPRRVISPIFGSDKDSYAVTINNLEYDSEKPKRSVIGTVFSPIFGRDRIIEDAVDEVDEKIANMTTSDFISDDIQPEEKEEKITKEEEVEVAKPLYRRLKVEDKSVEETVKTPIENTTLFDAERVNKALNEAKVAFDEIEKAAKPLENTSSYENISLFD